ncbi:hypothetical protein SEA_LIBERTYBELL_46 [Streptomyces phage LibertyBell]|nr:hypothetical protein SEA_LIBERTYBELL_46 [Streptomyces phage LibertyBell]
MDFPGNSIKQTINAETSTEENPAAGGPVEGSVAAKGERLKKVADAKTPKKTFGQSLRSVFVPDGKSMTDYFVNEILIPQAKDIVISVATDTVDGFKMMFSQAADSIKDGIQERMFGEFRRRPRSTTTSYGTGRPVVNYGAYSKTTSRTETTRETRPILARRSNRLQEVRVETRDIGDQVLEHLDGKITETGFATVGDFYDLVGITPVHTDDSWGWGDLSQARVERLAVDDYLIKMPTPEPLPR